jgi:hypothetical protein
VVLSSVGPVSQSKIGEYGGRDSRCRSTHGGSAMMVGRVQACRSLRLTVPLLVPRSDSPKAEVGAVSGHVYYASGV